MPATTTLSTTGLVVELKSNETQVKVVSTSGLTPGMALFCEGELMTVVSLGVDPWVNVKRGVGGAPATYHEPGATIYIGRPDQFYMVDPTGSPVENILVSPYINTVNGTIWFAQGDSLEGAYRWWQKQQTVYGVGPLGVRTYTLDPTSST